MCSSCTQEIKAFLILDKVKRLRDAADSKTIRLTKLGEKQTESRAYRQAGRQTHLDRHNSLLFVCVSYMVIISTCHSG